MALQLNKQTKVISDESLGFDFETSGFDMWEKFINPPTYQESPIVQAYVRASQNLYKEYIEGDLYSYNYSVDDCIDKTKDENTYKEIDSCR